MRVQPRWWIGVVVYLVYNAIIFATWAIVGADYRNLVGSDVAFKSLVLPLFLGAVFMVATLFWLGWWRPVMTEDRRGRPGWALWVVLAVMLGFILVNVSAANWSALAAGHLALLIAAGVLVGFNEESLTRGVLVVATRGSTSSETLVWFWSTFLFGLMHLPNGFFGAGLIASSLQVVFAFLGGAGFYVLRRLGGTLLIPMALHGAWDFVTFSVTASGAEAPAIRTYFQFGTYLVSIVLVIVVLLFDRKPRPDAA